MHKLTLKHKGAVNPCYWDFFANYPYICGVICFGTKFGTIIASTRISWQQYHYYLLLSLTMYSYYNNGRRIQDIYSVTLVTCYSVEIAHSPKNSQEDNMLFGKIIKCSSNLRLMQNATHCDADSRYSLNRLKPIFVCACKHAPCKVFKELLRWVMVIRILPSFFMGFIKILCA